MLALHCRSWETSNSSELTARVGFSSSKKMVLNRRRKELSEIKEYLFLVDRIVDLINQQHWGSKAFYFYLQVSFSPISKLCYWQGYLTHWIMNESELLPWGCWSSSEYWSINPDVNFGWSAMSVVYRSSILCLGEYPILSGTVWTGCRSVFRVFLCTKSGSNKGI